MHIREAIPEDGKELQEIQGQCPQGTTVIVATVNTPDFFARAKAYESYKVYVALDGNRIVGSMACALRDGLIDGQVRRLGYQFQGFTSLQYRRKSVATALLLKTQEHLVRQGADISYTLIMEGNRPSARLVERHGFKLHRSLIMKILATYQNMEIGTGTRIRSVEHEDLAAVAELLNETWEGFDFHEPRTESNLGRFIHRTPGFNLDSLLILEVGDRIEACIGFWDWSSVAKITIKGINLRLKLTGVMLDVVRCFRPMPVSIKPGTVLRQMVVTPVAFKDPAHIEELFKYLNNVAVQRGIEQLFFICEADHPLLKATGRFISNQDGMHVYAKPLKDGISLSDKPVFIDAVDL